MDTETPPTYPLTKGRAHEVCGPGAYFFAFVMSAMRGGKILFVHESWQSDQINPNGLYPYFDPGRLLIAMTNNQQDALAVTEEALRSGAVSVVITRTTGPLGLTEGRRLQLAARDGKSTGICIIPDGLGCNAAETRWHCAPVFRPSGPKLQCWKLIKNKKGPLGAWHVRWDWSTRRIVVVPSTRERSASKVPAGE